MQTVFKKAVVDVFENSFGLPIDTCRSRPAGKALTSEIHFELERKRFKAKLFFRKKLLVSMAHLLLEEKRPNAEILEDLANELTNQIVGHAKMLASDGNLDCLISTPTFEGVLPMPNSRNDTEAFKIDGNCLILQIEKIDD